MARMNFRQAEKFDRTLRLHETKIQTKKLSLLQSFYLHVILEYLKTFIKTNFRFKRVLCFAIQDA